MVRFPDLPTDEFWWRAHFLDANFKRSLAEYRKKWFAQDHTENPVLTEMPDAFDRVLAPPEIEKLERITRGRPLPTSRPEYDHMSRLPDQEKFRRRWPMYPGRIPWVCAEAEDLGEVSLVNRRWNLDARTPPKVVRMKPQYLFTEPELAERALSRVEEVAKRDGRFSDNWDFVAAWRNLGYPVILVHPGMTKMELLDAGKIAGVVGESKGRKKSRVVEENGEVKLRVLRWFAVGDQMRKAFLPPFSHLRGGGGWHRRVAAEVVEWLSSHRVRAILTGKKKLWVRSDDNTIDDWTNVIQDWTGTSGQSVLRRLESNLSIHIRPS